MRLVRLVVAGVAVGAVGGYVGALVRPRTVYRNPAADLDALDPAPASGRRDDAASPELTTLWDTVEARR
jgi:hypothetical protein